MNDPHPRDATPLPGGSVSLWIQELKNGDGHAAQKLWDRYFRRILGLARKRLSGRPQRAMDEEDVAQSVFRSLCLGAPQGDFPELTDRDDLWPLLAKITNRKAANQIRWENRKKRGGGETRGESALHHPTDAKNTGFDQLSRDELPPDVAVEMAEECQRMIDSLPDDTYRFVVWNRLEGRTNDEIAGLLGVTTRSVERKIQLVRESLSRKLAENDRSNADET